MKVDIWMPVYIGDYLSDTLDLRAIGHGCYFLLLMHYWKKGELVKDTKKLMTIARLDDDESHILDEILLNYFEEKDGKYYQKRADEEIKKANSRRNTATENGKKGGRPHKIDNLQETGGFSDSNPEKSSSPLPSPLPIESKKGKEEKRITRTDSINSDFDKFYLAYPKKKSKDDARKAFKSRYSDLPVIDELISKLGKLAKSDDWKKENGKFVPYPASWIRAGGWEDEISTQSSPLPDYATKQNYRGKCIICDKQSNLKYGKCKECRDGA